MQLKSVAARTEPARSPSGSELTDPDAMDRARLYDLIVRFRLRPVRDDAGRAVPRGTQSRSLRLAPDPVPAACVGESGIERFGRGVIIIDALGRVLFVNRTAEWLLEGRGALDRSAAGYLRFPTRELQRRFVEYLIHSRRIERGEGVCGERRASIELRSPVAERGDACQITVAPLLDRPLARLVERSGPLHAVFVYESPCAIDWL